MIDILLAAHNGEKYLAQQLDSLLKQTFDNVVVRVNDDGSTDGTWNVIQTYAEKYPKEIVATQNEGQEKSASGNFFGMLSQSRAPYVMFCDQDDVWAAEKVRLSITAMEKEEEKTGPDYPLLLHTDLEVTDENLKPVAPSFMRYQDLDPFATSLPKLVAQNNVTGCTILMNAAMRELVRVPAEPVMYDWWIGLCASAFGKILYLNDATILYRQHGSNVVGAKNARSVSYGVARMKDADGIRRSLSSTYKVAKLFLTAYEDRLDAAQKEFLSSYAKLNESGVWSRWRVLSKYGAFKKGIRRQVGQILFG